MADVVCENCGGTDFYKEAGFYFCNECQIQSQEIREHVFQDTAEQINTKTTRKIQSDKTDKTENKITSWECYNYILLGLTQELINLGADLKLKSVVRVLWLRYLEKLQVFKRGKSAPPKLQAVNSTVDAQIIYGHAKKRRRSSSKKSSSDDLDVTTLDSSSIKRERAKKKRALIQAHYDDFSQKSKDTSSLHNETLTSLQSDSEKSSKNAIRYNIYAAKELRRQYSKKHLRKHQLDFNRELSCHKITYHRSSFNYQQGPSILSLNKLYGLLYLGLIIIKDNIQLNDILKFIKDGRLSFNCYSKLLPEDFASKFVNFRDFKKNTLFANYALRSITLKLARFLKLEWYIIKPDLIRLCERYCKELNLPDSICDCVKNIISRSKIKMRINETTIRIPNYEGRVLSIILFVLKLLFGLDDVTEFELGKYSQILNQSDSVSPKMFDIVKWLRFIEFRQYLLNNFSIASNFNGANNMKDIDNYLDLISKREFKEKPNNKVKDDYDQLLTKLKEHDNFNENDEQFQDYTEAIIAKHRHLISDTNYEIITYNFKSDDLEHILNPKEYLEAFNACNKINIINRGANSDIIFEQIQSVKSEISSNIKHRQELTIVKLELNPKLSVEESVEVDNLQLLENFDICNKLSTKTLTNFDKPRGAFRKIKKDIRKSGEIYQNHYLPYERFCLRIKRHVEYFNLKDCHKYVREFPYNFRIVFKECLRLSEQNEREFLQEYQQTELYLIYLANFTKNDTECRHLHKNKQLERVLSDISASW